MTEINWKELACKVGAVTPEGEVGGTEYARKALVEILGEDLIIGAVRAFLALESGSELARNVLWVLRPDCALRECFRRFSESQDVEERRLSVALIASIPNRLAVEWVQEFLDDKDSEIQSWGATVLLNLVFEDQVEEDEVRSLISVCERHQNETVRKVASQILSENEVS